MKLKFLLCCMVFTFLIAPFTVSGAVVIDNKNTQAEEIILYYNGVELKQKGLKLSGDKIFTTGGYDYNIYVPVRTYSSMRDNYDVMWDEEVSAANLYMTDKENIAVYGLIAYKATIGSRMMVRSYPYSSSSYDRWESLMPYEAFLYEGRTMVPYSFGSDLLYWITESEELPAYYENKLCYFDKMAMGKITAFLRGSDPEKYWRPMKELASSRYALITNEEDGWSLSILSLENENGVRTEEKHLLGDNFELLYNSREDMQFNFNGLRIKKENGEYFLNELDLISLGIVAEWNISEESSEEFKGMTFEFIPAD